MAQVVAIVSGKGGTGKTSLCACIACWLAKEGQQVLCVDADVGLRNLDLSLGMAQDPALPFTDVMNGVYPLSSAAVHPQYPNLHFLTAPVTLAPEELDREALCRFLQEAKTQFDWIFVDAPAGIGAGFELAAAFADQALVVTGGDPAALRDGSRTAQALELCSQAQAKLIVNRIRRSFFRRTRSTVDDCMDLIGLPLLGIVPEDPALSLAAARGEPLCSRFPVRGASLACQHIARRLLGMKQPLMNL